MNTNMSEQSSPTAENENENENEEVLENLFTAVAEAPLSALLLDYDGTLAPFVVDRHLAVPYKGVTELLRHIMLCGRTRMAIISGREAHEVEALLGLKPPPEIWGSHGVERLRPNGTVESKHFGQAGADALQAASDWLSKQRLQHLAEVKPGGIAVHWRGLSRARARQVRDLVSAGWAPIVRGGRMLVVDFDGGIEIRVPQSDKGHAVQAIVSEMDATVPIAYLGDDTTDEDAFRSLGSRGVSALVRQAWRPTDAQLWLKPPHELIDFLTRWLNACERKTETLPLSPPDFLENRQS
jgi:trehalose 6-phosphate phosphatase